MKHHRSDDPAISNSVKDEISTARRRWAIAALWFALAMAVLDGSIANVALPAIATSLGVPPNQVIWVVNAYQLAIVSTLLPLAALGQIITFRSIFLGGVLIFVVGSVACLFAETLPELIVARAIQGLGAASVLSSNGALLRDIFPTSRLGAAVGMNAVVISISAAAGPSIAAAVLSVANWPALFVVNVPLGITALLLGWFAIPVSARQPQRFDALAAFLNLSTFVSVIIGIDLMTRGDSAGWGALLIGGGLVSAYVLIRRTGHQTMPMIPIDLMRATPFALAILASFASFVAQMLAFIGLPFLLHDDFKLDLVTSGLLLCTWPVAGAIVSPLAGRLSDRNPASKVSVIGIMVVAGGLMLLSRSTRSTAHLLIVAYLALCGVGFSLFQLPNNRDILGQVPKDRAGAAGAMMALTRVAGQSLGATLAAVIFAMTANGAGWSLRAAMLAAIVAGLVSLKSLRLGGSKRLPD